MKRKEQKPPKKMREQVLEAIKQHAWNMGVSKYEGDVLYMKEDKDSETGTHNNKVAADITIDRRYLTFELKIYPMSIDNWKFREKEGKKGHVYVDEIIAHEMAHLLTTHLHWLATVPYKDEGETTDAWESLTTQIGRMSLQIQKLEKKKS